MSESDFIIEDGVLKEYTGECTYDDSVVTIPEGVTAIGNGAFEDRCDITKVTIPESVTSIGANAFKGCECLEEVVIPDSVISIGDYAFEGCFIGGIDIPNSVTYIGRGAFGYSAIDNINIPSSVTYIGDKAFFQCTALSKVTILNKDIRMGEDVFKECDQLHKITAHRGFHYGSYPYSVEYIPEIINGLEICGDVLTECLDNDIETVEIPECVTVIGRYAFKNCKNLEEVYLSANIDEEAFAYCNNLKKVVIQDGTSFIGECAFYHCKNLQEVVVSDTVTKIEERAFDGCSHLKKVSGLKNVTSIGKDAFYGCNELTEISTPKLHYNAFRTLIEKDYEKLDFEKIIDGNPISCKMSCFNKDGCFEDKFLSIFENDTGIKDTFEIINAFLHRVYFTFKCYIAENVRHLDYARNVDEAEELIDEAFSMSWFPNDLNVKEYSFLCDEDQDIFTGNISGDGYVDGIEYIKTLDNSDDVFLFKLNVLSTFIGIYKDDPNFKDVIQTIVDTILCTLPLIIADKDAQYIKELLENPTYKNLWFKESISALEQYAKEGNLTPLQEALPQLDFE